MCNTVPTEGSCGKPVKPEQTDAARYSQEDHRSSAAQAHAVCVLTQSVPNPNHGCRVHVYHTGLCSDSSLLFLYASLFATEMFTLRHCKLELHLSLLHKLTGKFAFHLRGGFGLSF